MPTEYGNRDLALGGEILRTVVGSGVHGIAIEGTDDHDEMGVFVEPPDQVLGLDRRMEHYVFRTQPEGARSGPGDLDLVVYSLRKYLRLATKGNPTALLPLYAPTESVVVLQPLGAELRELAPAMLSRRAVHRFVGYMNSQRTRLLAGGRPDLVARFGYDVKYACHALRLAYQGLEIIRDGCLTLPMPDHEREQVLRVKRGDVPILGEVLTEISDVQAQIERRLDTGDTHCPRSRTSAPSRPGQPPRTVAIGAGRHRLVDGASQVGRVRRQFSANAAASDRRGRTDSRCRLLARRAWSCCGGSRGRPRRPGRASPGRAGWLCQPKLAPGRRSYSAPPCSAGCMTVNWRASRPPRRSPRTSGSTSTPRGKLSGLVSLFIREDVAGLVVPKVHESGP
jgi:uncharacterized protein